MLPDISWAAFGVAAVANFVVGGAWYAALGNAWMKELGFTREMVQGEKWPMPAFPIAIVAAIVHAFVLAAVLGWAEPAHAGVTLAIAAGLGVAAALATGKHEAFSRKTWKLFFIDGGNDLAGFLAMGVVFALWPA